MTAATLASEYVTDTMALVLRLERRKMSAGSAAAFEAMEKGTVTIYIPAIVFAEVLYLSEKHRITASLTSVAAYLNRYPNCKEQSLSLSVAETAAQISDIPELHDRLIAATARLLNRSLITNDPVIAASQFVNTIW
jgi:predicted nucleic acid-binding protein